VASPRCMISRRNCVARKYKPYDRGTRHALGATKDHPCALRWGGFFTATGGSQQITPAKKNR